MAHSPPTQALQVIGHAGRGLRVLFDQQADRCAHRIELVDGTQSCCLLSSVEGTSDQAWPPSPPLQQVSIEEFAPASRVALLLGMAGRSHWSVSVECAAEPVSLLFDVACRVQQVPERLGSCYHTAVPVAAVAPDRVRLAVAQSVVTVQLLPLANSPPVALEWSADELTIVCRDLVTVPAPATLRWKYRVTLTELVDDK